MECKFAVFILSNGRAGNILTIDKLIECGYTGLYFVLVDNEDPTIDDYRVVYGDRVIVFNKAEIARRIDEADLGQDRRTVVYARNACFDIAHDMGLDYFLELDDDYVSFMYRFSRDGGLRGLPCKQLDRLFACMIEFLESTNALTVAFAQGGDFIGGMLNDALNAGLLRKVMNTFFLKTSRRLEFPGRMNEDVSAYTLYGSQGSLFLTVSKICIVQKPTQSNAGGMSGAYLDSGTYAKSFYTIMYMPSAVKIGVIATKNKRIHHIVSWENCVPKIISDEHRK